MDALELAKLFHTKYDSTFYPNDPPRTFDPSGDFGTNMIRIFEEILTEITPVIQKDLLLALDDQIKVAAKEAVLETLEEYIKVEEARWLNGTGDNVESLGILRNVAIPIEPLPEICICELPFPEQKDVNKYFNVSGHRNQAGGYCCPHYGNTCGDHPEYK